MARQTCPRLHSATHDGGGGDGDGDGDGAAVGLRAVQRQRLTAGLYRLMSQSAGAPLAQALVKRCDVAHGTSS